MKYVLSAGVALGTLALSACDNSALASVHYDGYGGLAGEGDYRFDQDGDVSLTGSDMTVSGRVGGDLSLVGSDLRVNATIGGSMSLAGSDVAFEGRIAQEANIAGSDVNWSGDAGGDVEIAGSDIDWSGSTDGSLSIAGSDVSIDGLVRRNLDVAGSDIELSRRSNISGDASIAGSDVDLNGSIGGTADIMGSSVDLDGAIQGYALISAYPEGRRSWGTNGDYGRVRVNGELPSGGAICARSVVFGSSVQIGEDLHVYADETPMNMPTSVVFELLQDRDCDDVLDQHDR